MSRSSKGWASTEDGKKVIASQPTIEKPSGSWRNTSQEPHSWQGQRGTKRSFNVLRRLHSADLKWTTEMTGCPLRVMGRLDRGFYKLEADIEPVTRHDELLAEEISKRGVLVVRHSPSWTLAPALRGYWDLSYKCWFDTPWKVTRWT